MHFNNALTNPGLDLLADAGCVCPHVLADDPEVVLEEVSVKVHAGEVLSQLREEVLPEFVLGLVAGFQLCNDCIDVKPGGHHFSCFHKLLPAPLNILIKT